MQNSEFLNLEQHLLHDETPSTYLNEFIHSSYAKEKPFLMLARLEHTEQSPIHHPEGNAWIHTMMAVDQAAKIKDKSKDPRCLMWAALLHDIGKPDTTKRKNGRIVSYDHDQVGADLAREFLSLLTNDTSFINTVCGLVRYHMHILYVTKSLPYQDLKGLYSHTNYHELALLGYCDRMGRTNVDENEVAESVEKFLKMVER